MRPFAVDIVEIDNLVGMEKLTKLQLDNNIITKISGLESLVNLTWLDLSFNLISKIEGLETLSKLEDLSLFQNRITKLENLEELKCLNLFSVGSNELSNFDESIKYLKTLDNNLEVLKIKGNKFKDMQGEGKNYKQLTIAFLQRLKYLDYELIDPKEREEAISEKRDDIQSFATSDQNEEKQNDDGPMDAELQAAHIGSTKNMFIKVLKGCEDYFKVSAFQKFLDVYQTSEGNIDELVSKFQGDMKASNKKKSKVIAFCVENLQGAEREAERASVAKIDEYRKKEKHIYRAIETQRRIENDGPLPNYDIQEKELVTMIEVLNGELLDIEIKLQGALKVSTGQFTTQVGAIIADMKSFSEELFKEVAVEV